MAVDVRVDCVVKETSAPLERIASLGGPNPNGVGRWRLSEAEAIAGIEAGKFSFYVERPAGHRVRVLIATRLGRKYLKTEADGERPDNLLSLQRCG